MGAISFSIDESLLAFLRQQLPLEVFVETGTFRGDSLRLARICFRECYSVELSKDYHAAAINEFAGHPDVHLHWGKSADFLRAQQARFSRVPALFWLDAHWCVAENTAGAESQSPLLDELRAMGSVHPQSVVLIDDARLYLSPPPAPHRVGDWPDFHAILLALQDLSARHRLLILNDVLIFYPEGIKAALAQFARDHGEDWLVIADQSRKYQARKKRWARLRRVWQIPFWARRPSSG